MLAPGTGTADCHAAFAAAGQALARLHGSGLALGRGKAKDFCWDGCQITFIDLEVSPGAFVATTSGRRNLVNFVFDLQFAALSKQRDAHSQALTFLRAYAGNGGAHTQDALRAAQRWARRRWWLGSLSLPVAFLRAAGRSPDFKAMTPTLIMFAYLEATLGDGTLDAESSV